MKVYLVSNYRGEVAFGSLEDARAVAALVGESPERTVKEVYLVQGEPELRGLGDLIAAIGGTDE